MHVGMGTVFQGWGGTLSDKEVYEVDVHLADLAEPLGFESIWGVEHHFTDYTMCPDIIQFLTFMAGRTTHAKVGSMVTILPWHDPVRLAEQIIMLDHLSKGRLILGIGRGTGKVEFDGFRLDMSKSRQTFIESAEAILSALETGVMEYDGEIIKQPRVELRPGPYKSFKNRVFSASVSPESAKIMADLGTGLLVVPQKPWKRVLEDVENFRKSFDDAFQAPPPPPFTQTLVLVDADEKRAHELGRKYLGGYWASVVAHYKFNEPHLTQTPGYEFHATMYERLNKPGGMEEMTEFYLTLVPYGTPEQVYEKLKEFTGMLGAQGLIAQFRYAGMPLEIAEPNMRLFAAEVLPALKQLDHVPPTPLTERILEGAGQ